MFERLPLAGAEVALDPAWLPRREADALFARLLAEVDWETHRIRLFGREVDAPRRSSWIGEPGAAYTYSRTRFEPRPWPEALAALRPRVEAAAGAAFDSVLANLYRDGRDAMGWHADDEPELGPAPVIASLSLGAARRFQFKRRVAGARAVPIDLPHGSLLLMRGATQAHYRHALPRTARPVGPRINLTFRRVRAEAGQERRDGRPVRADEGGVAQRP
ncbi:alpha-ketoglutarate-dependent dioxygenase AlkB family protein [Coralloluteibacterium stylophorae]|uniref:Alpha-ketoglutarate-dependent dioxygenase AlkB n=1 Tax=Coralloluteibacterium stylophorae TaxID=1776034 RepID=A0A8J7VWQ0_9GAMM|nr:alpha-ketoglutarate-dependent dioxygenase AlkB [Coralloluteibacterium stylophorae]MBS7457808.1 alpha-ketoglutarate-dependent dioxygenase AlkB [Coralloluteibacterium stylophorae]